MKPHRNAAPIILLSTLTLMAAPPRSVAQTPMVETLPASGMLNDAATFNGSANPNGAETTVWFEWGTVHDSGFGNQTEPQSIGDGTTDVPISAALSNLVQGATYHCRIAASNSFGVVRGEEQRFWTPRIDLNTSELQIHKRGTPFVDLTTVHATDVRAITAGGYHTLALRLDGSVFGWGRSSEGQCTVPAHATNVVAIAGGNRYSMALRADGSVVAWGSNYEGEAIPPSSATNVTAIAAGHTHGLALRDGGSVVAWGYNDYGQTTVPAHVTNAVAVAGGRYYSLALLADGSVVAWGYNDYGQTTVPAHVTTAVAVAAGGYHSLALLADGSVTAWGDNTWGQTTIPADATNVVAIAAGGVHNLVLRADGSVVAWGNGGYGQCTIPASATNVVAIAAGEGHSMALRNDGSVVPWGDSSWGQGVPPDAMTILDLPLAVDGMVNTNILGTYVLDYSTTNALGAVATATRTVTVVHVAAEPATEIFNASAMFNGTVNPDGTETTIWFEWGTVHDNGSVNQTEPQSIGDGTADVPVSDTLSNLPAGNIYWYRLAASNSYWVARSLRQRFWTPRIDFHDPAFLTVEPGTFIDLTTVHVPPPEIAAGGYHNLALRADGSVVGWGWNGHGQTNLPAYATNVANIAAGSAHSLALLADGTVAAWGWNGYGQSTVPSHITDVADIAAGSVHNLALRTDGTVLGWGGNSYGQCNIPASATNVVDIAVGQSHSLALRNDGSVVAWGNNDGGQCNVTTHATNVMAIAAGGSHSLALRADGSVIGWGHNAEGQAIPPASAINVVAIAAGQSHSLALRADGTVVGWGRNYEGQAIPPAGASNIVAIAASSYHNLALRVDGTGIGWGGDNYYSETTIPGDLSLPSPPLVGDGTVDVNTLGTYVLDYSTTNTLGAVATASRTVVVATLPIMTTEPATGIGADQVTLRGSANPRASETLAWFEYGLGGSYGHETPPIPLGDPTNAVPFATGRSDLLPYMTYHYRAVASNGIGRAEGSDRTFTLSAPSFGTPVLSALDDLFLPQSGSTSVWFAAAPAGVDVGVACNNPILLPEGSLVLGGSILGIAPDPEHSGSAQITVTASDGMQSDSQTFTLTVVPVDPSQLLNLESQTVSGGTWRLQVHDDGTASTNYIVEYRPDLSPTSTWSAAANVVELGGGEYDIDLGAPPGDTGFFRIKGLRMLMGGFDSAEVSAEEGAAASGAVVVFNSIFTGTLNYTWTDETGTTHAGSVEVDGTTAVIPLPAAFLDDDTGIGRLEHLTLELDAGTGYVHTGDPESRMTIEENDADWQGMIETDGAMLGFTLTMLQDNGAFNGRIQSEGFGFFPTNALVQLSFAEDTFTAVATDIPLQVFEDDPELGFTAHLDLRLDAANHPGETNVAPDRIEGEATLVAKVPGQPYLDAAATGPFVLIRPPTAASTNEVPLYPIP